MNLKNKLILIDSTISYNDIKNFEKDSDFITFDYESHVMLKKNNIEHKISDSFIKKHEFDIIQEKLYRFSNWYDDEKISKELKYKYVNLGSLFYIELWMFLIPIVKKFFEIIKISSNLDTKNIFASQIVCQMGRCLQFEFQNISDAQHDMNYFYDNFKFDSNFFSLKLSSKNFNKLKNLSEKFFHPFTESSKKIPNNAVLLIEFNTVKTEVLLQEFRKNNIDVISYCRRRPAIWNSKSLQVIRKTKCIVPSYSDLINDKILENVSKESQEKLRSIMILFENDNIFSKIFEINGVTFWEFLKPYLFELFKKRLEQSILEIELTHQILKKTRPKCVLIQSESGNTEQIVLSISKKLKIPVILLQHGFLKSSEGGFKLNKFTKSIMNHSDQFMVWGNFMLDNAQKFNMDMKKIFALGAYTHDELFNLAPESEQKNKNLLLLTEGPIWDDVREYNVHELDEYKNSLIHIFQTAKSLKRKLIVKLHPYENDHNEQEIAKKIDSSIVVVKKRNSLSLIQSSDVVILLGTSISTAVLDAIILNKPVIRLPFGEWYGDYGDGSCINIEKNEFKEKLNQIINNKEFRQQIIEDQKRFLNDYLINQGCATQKIVSHIHKIVNSGI